jgi:hypothetical protein
MRLAAEFALVTILVVAIGGPFAFAVCRRVFLSLVLAPLFAVVTACLSCFLMMIFGGGFLVWLIPVTLTQAALSVWWIRAGKRAPMPCGGFVDVLLLAVPAAPPFLMAFGPPYMWDARKIWWLHGAYFSQGGEYTRYAIGHPQISASSHTDYPPALSSLVALAWSVFSGHNFYLAQLTSALLTFSAVVACAYAVRVATSQAPATLSRLAAAGSTVAAWTFSYTLVAAGYSDALWGAAFAAAVVILCYAPPGPVRSVLPGILLAVAALSKNEGLIAVMALAVVLFVRHRGRVRQLAGVLAGIAAGLTWIVLSRAFGAASDMAGSDALSRLTDLDEAASRIGLVLRRTHALVGTEAALLGLLILLLGNLFLRRQRRQLGIGPDGWLWAVTLVYFAALIGTYVVTPHPVEWHVTASLDRVMVVVSLLASASLLCWVVVAVAGRTPAGQQPDPAVPSAPDTAVPAVSSVAGHQAGGAGR